MSKIYKALEKAEMERESRKDIHPVPIQFPSSVKPKEMTSDQQLVSVSQPGSVAAEQFRKLRNYVLRPKGPAPLRTIMVAAAMSGEGKTFVAVNLAASIASDLHSHALLVDCDLRDPSVAQCFGFRNGKGLSDYLRGNETLSEILRKTEVEKLSVLTAGSILENPTELIGSKKMEALVHELKSRYTDRYIIFDSTPLLATSETELLSKLVDGIIFVTRAGVTPRETVKQALSFIEKGKLLGFVLNDLQFRSSGLSSRYFGSGGYYYRYRYGYGYGYGKNKAKSQKRHWGKGK
jgi:exopolysaccharide/PEP-CTERM locus tyrosine autokinase